MSRSNKSFAIAYFLLVGIPLLGLAEVLHLGHNLTAPNSVGGVWEVTTGAAPWLVDQCGLGGSGRKVVMIVAQSGKHLITSLADSPTAAGVLEGDTLRVDSVRGLGTPHNRCGGPELSLAGKLLPWERPARIIGTFSLPGCRSCPLLPFTAVKRNDGKGSLW